MHSLRHTNHRQQSVLDVLFDLCKRPVGPVRHALGFAADIARRVNVNGELAGDVADSLDLDRMAVLGLAKLLASGKFSPERLACVAMLDQGLDDDDIAEIFGRSVKWAQVVRSQAAEIRAEEPMDPELEWFDPAFRPEDPSPDEILRLARELRGRDLVPGLRDSYRAGIRCYSRSENSGAFVSVGVA